LQPQYFYSDSWTNPFNGYSTAKNLGLIQPNWVASVAVQCHPAALYDPPPDFVIYKSHYSYSNTSTNV